MGTVTHRDDNVSGVVRGEQSRAGVGEVELRSSGRGDRAGVNSLRGMGAGRAGVVARARPVERGGELRASRVVRAHEQHRTGRSGRDDPKASQRLADEADVPAAPVTGRGEPFDQPGLFEDVEVVSQAVRRQVEVPSQLGGRPVRGRQVLHDPESDWVTEGGMKPGPLRDVSSHDGETIHSE